MRVFYFIIFFGIYISTGQSHNCVRFDTQGSASDTITKSDFLAAQYLIYDKGENKGDTLEAVTFYISVAGVEKGLHCSGRKGFIGMVRTFALQSAEIKFSVPYKISDKYIRRTNYLKIVD